MAKKPDYDLIRRLEAEVHQDPEELAGLRPVRPDSDNKMVTEQSSTLTKRLAAAWTLVFVVWVISMVVAKLTSPHHDNAWEGWMPARLSAYVASIVLVAPFAAALVFVLVMLVYYVARGKPHPWWAAHGPD